MVSTVGSGMSKMERFTRNLTVNIHHSLNLIRMTAKKTSFGTLFSNIRPCFNNNCKIGETSVSMNNNKSF